MENLAIIKRLLNKLQKTCWNDTEPICKKGCIGPYKDSKRGCCANCANSNAHTIGRVPPQEKYLKLKYKFNLKTGYFREGKGCMLPRKYRSGACLMYLCPEIREELNLRPYDRGAIAGLIDFLCDLRGY